MFSEERGREIIWDFAIGSFVYTVVLLLLCFLQSRAGCDGLQANKKKKKKKKNKLHTEASFTTRKEPRLCCF